ncbi:MAG: T9SS type A sorting domain-containing protein [Bacteroidales bacterium]|jgi:hypothetical protein|nr:T9SS type A sorting domain-containing protein [Bacteroidales bacterium]
MKNKIILLALMIFAFVLQGQEYSYIPYVQEGSIWSYVYRSRSGIGQNDYTSYFTQYEIKGDTCINSDCYKKLFRGCPQNQQYYGALRELDKRVYFFEKGSDSEELIYDFSLKTGDTFLICTDITPHTIVVSDIDSVQINGGFRKRFYFKDGFGGIQIEGIGSIFDFRELCGITSEDAYYNLNYKKENGETVYYSTEVWFTENDCGTQQEYDNAPWCPKGAMWTYSYNEGMMSSGYFFLKYIYEKDTVIHETDVKAIGVYNLNWTHNYNMENLKWTRHVRKIADEYLYERNDSIFRYDHGNDCFIFLYSWNFNLGDTFVAKSLNILYNKVFYSPEGEVDSVSVMLTPIPETFFVSSVSNQNIGEKLFKKFDVQPVNRDTTPYPISLNFGPVISKIGSFFHPFPYPKQQDPSYNEWSCIISEYGKYGVLTHGSMNGLYCYSDSVRGYPVIMNDYVAFDGFDLEKPYCLDPDTVLVSNEDKMSGQKKQNKSIYKLYPNPVFDEVIITSEENTVIKKITILSTKGEDVLTVFGNHRRISANALPAGIYMMRITDSEGHWETLKFIKTK